MPEKVGKPPAEQTVNPQGTRQRFERLRTLGDTIFGRKGLKARIADLESQQKLREDTVLGLEDNNASLREQIRTLSTNLEDALEIIGELRQDKANLVENARVLENAIAELEKSRATNETSILEFATQLKEAKRNLGENEERMAKAANALGEMKNALEATGKSNAQLTRDITTLIKSSSILFTADADMDDALRKFASMMIKELEFSNCTVLVFNKQKGALQIVAQSGYVDDSTKEIEILPGQGITGSCFDEGKMQEVADITNCRNYVCGDPRTMSELAAPIKRRDGRILGVLDVQSMKKNAFDELDASLLQALATRIGIAMENVHLYEKLKQANIELRNHFAETTYALIRVLEDRSHVSRGHSQYVAKYAVLMGKEMELSSKELKQLKCAALLHDIGKVGIADNILHKPGQLTKTQWKRMQRHPIIGGQIIRNMALFTQLAPVIEQHHLWWDGTHGYGKPADAKGEQIHPFARIIAVADAFEAMIGDRHHYREKSKLPYEAAQEVLRCSGTQFDPGVVGAFKRSIMPKILAGDLPMYKVRKGGARHTKAKKPS
jgi:HD-GYP domain-containing protein (c-di-GMP phosphodiesterase class II)